MKKSTWVTPALLALAVFVAGCFGGQKVSQNPTTTSLVKPDNILDEPAKTESSNEPAKTEDAETVYHRTLAITKPAGWKEIEYGAILIYLPEDDEVADPLSEKITVAVGYTPKNNTVPLDEIMDADLEDTKKLVPDIREVMDPREEANLGPLSGLKTRYEYTIQNRGMEVTQINAIQETESFEHNIIYRVGHNCIKDGCKYSGVFWGMVDSFQPLEPKE